MELTDYITATLRLLQTPPTKPKEHIGLYPPTISSDESLDKAVAKYAGPKGNLQFPLNAPIPYNLIERMVKLRVQQDSAKATTKKQKRSK